MISLGCNVKEKGSRCITYTNVCKCYACLQRQPVRSRESPLDPGLPDGSRTKGRARWGDCGGSGGRGGQDHSSSSSSGASSGVGVSPGFSRQPSHSPNPRLELVCSSPGAWNTNQLSTFELLLVGKETTQRSRCHTQWSGAGSSTPLRGGGGEGDGAWVALCPLLSPLPTQLTPRPHPPLSLCPQRSCGSSRSVHR